MKFHLAVCTALLVVATHTICASAQNVAAKQEMPTEVLQWRELPLKNGDPEDISWTLDPRHNRSLARIDFTAMRSAWRNPPALPNGVQSVVGVDSLRSLLVFSTAKGLQELQKLVDPLDQLVREIDIRIRLITIDALTLASLQLDPQSENIATGPEQTYTTLEISATELAKLDALIAQGKVQELPINNYPFISRYKNNKVIKVSTSDHGVKIQSFVSEPLRKSIQESHIAGDPEILFYRGNVFSMKPTINEDKTISIELLLTKGMGLYAPGAAEIGSGQKSSQDFALQTRDKFAGTVKIKNGSAIALLRSNIYAPSTAKEATASTEFLLLTARIALPTDDEILYYKR